MLGAREGGAPETGQSADAELGQGDRGVVSAGSHRYPEDAIKASREAVELALVTSENVEDAGEQGGGGRGDEVEAKADERSRRRESMSGGGRQAAPKCKSMQIQDIVSQVMNIVPGRDKDKVSKLVIKEWVRPPMCNM